MIYNTGTIAINGNTATGSGTNWTAPASQIRVSQTIIVLSNPIQMFQVTAINSATSMTVTPAASPALSGQKYGILVTDSLSVDGLAQSMSQLIKQYDENIGAWETFAATSANQTITVTINGASVNIPGVGALARKGANSDITELKGLTTALSIAQGGTGAKSAADARSNLGLGAASLRGVMSYDTDTSNRQNLMPVGAFGLGTNKAWAPSYADANALEATGFYSAGGSNGSNFFDNYSPLICAFRAGGNDGSGQISQIQCTEKLFGFRYRNNGYWSPWRTVYSTGNTTVANDGTLKSASPMIKLFHDGKYETNEESEGCTVIRRATGEYFIEGCVGLNADATWGGWDGGFDIPTDRNKQPLIWLDYEVNAAGSVLVKTYHRTHPEAPAFARNELEGMSDGDPIDIPRDQFVSVRVEMPADSLYNQRIGAAKTGD